MIHFLAALIHKLSHSSRIPQRKYVKKFLPQGERLQNREMLAADLFGDTAIMHTEHDEPLVQIRLNAADLDGNSISSARGNEKFLLQVFVQDVRSEPAGIFSAYLDITYDQNLLSIDGPINYGAGFDFAQSGDVSSAGLIDEVGATVFSIGTGGEEMLLFSVLMKADSGGSLVFSSDPADILPDHEVTIFGGPIIVPNEKISFGSFQFDVLETTANDDSFEIAKNSDGNILDVLANDIVGTVDGNLRIIEVSSGSHGGTVSIENETALRYVPAADYSGTETFSYKIEDDFGNVSEADVTINIEQAFETWQNPDNNFDVDGNSLVNSLDLLKTIRNINAHGNRLLILPPPPGDILFVDVNGDTLVSPLDLVLLITELNRIAAEGEPNEIGEGESVLEGHVESPLSLRGMQFSETYSPAPLFQSTQRLDLLNTQKHIALRKNNSSQIYFLDNSLQLSEDQIPEKSVDYLINSWTKNLADLLYVSLDFGHSSDDLTIKLNQQ